MMLQQFFSAESAYRLGWAIIHSLWQGALIAGLLWTVLAALGRRPPQWRYLASTVAMTLMLIGMVLTFCLVTSPAPMRPQASAPVAAQERLAKPTPAVTNQPTPASSGPIDKPLALEPAIVAIPSPQSVLPTSRPPLPSLAQRMGPAMPWVVIAWALGVALLSMWNLGGWIAAQRLKVLGTHPVGADIAATAEKLARRLKLTKPVRVLQSLLAETPLVIGWLRPVVLLPASVLTGLTPAQLEAVLAHELAHIRRHDYLVNLFQVAAESLLFYHPAVWWISRRIRLEREQCCDDVAVSICRDRCTYIESLAALEEVRFGAPLALAARGAGGSQLLARIHRLLGLRDDSPRGTARALVAGAMLLLAVATFAVFYGKSAQTNAATHIEAKAVDGAEGWKVKLPSGVEVQLLGISNNPSDKQPWWKPDGSPASRPYQHFASWGAHESEVAREFAVRLSHVPTGDTSVRWQFDNHNRGMGSSSSAIATDAQGPIFAAVTTFSIAEKRAVVRVGIASGAWKTLAEDKSADGMPAIGGDVTPVPDGAILFGAVTEQNDGGTAITVSHSVTGKEVRVVAVDAAGHEHTSSSTQTGTVEPLSQVSVKFAGLAPKDVRSLRFQAREYEWAEFKDAALQSQAGPVTQPVTSVPPAAIDPWRVRLPCGVTAELVGVSKSPSSGQPWWRPDGSPLGHVPDHYPHEAELSDLNQPANQFAILLTDVPFNSEQGDYEIIDRIEANPKSTNGLSYTSGCWPTPPSADWKISEWNVINQSFSPSEDHTTIELGMAAGTWNTVSDHSVHSDGRWGAMSIRGLHGTNVDVSFAVPYEAAWRPDMKDQAAFITVAHNMPPDQQARIVAVLADGKEVASANNPQEANGHVQQLTQSFRGISIDDIKAFRLQSRPFQWAEFKNISLRPNPTTQPTAFEMNLHGNRLLGVGPAPAIRTHPATTQPDAQFVPRLEFRLVAEAGDKSAADEMIDADSKQRLSVLKTVELDERDVARAYPMKTHGGEAGVGVEFTDAGAKKFEKLTAANIHRRVAIVLKGALLSAPMIQTKTSQSAVISPGRDGFTDRQVQSLVDSINLLTESAATTQPASASATQPAALAPATQPVDWMYGMWINQRTDNPGPGEASFNLIKLSADGTWAYASLWGSAERPEKAAINSKGDRWELAPIAYPLFNQHHAISLPLQPEPCFNLLLQTARDSFLTMGSEMTRDGDDSIVFYSFESILTETKYRRASPAERPVLERSLQAALESRAPAATQPAAPPGTQPAHAGAQSAAQGPGKSAAAPGNVPASDGGVPQGLQILKPGPRQAGLPELSLPTTLPAGARTTRLIPKSSPASWKTSKSKWAAIGASSSANSMCSPCDLPLINEATGQGSPRIRPALRPRIWLPSV